MLQLLSRYTSQHSRVCIVHLALTLSNPGLPIRVFSSIIIINFVKRPGCTKGQACNPYNNF